LTRIDADAIWHLLALLTFDRYVWGMIRRVIVRIEVA
jgi:hypothetical protein